MISIDNQQKTMLDNAPSRAPKKAPSAKKKLMVVGLGIAVGAIAAYYIGPKVSGLIQAKRIAKATKVV